MKREKIFIKLLLGIIPLFIMCGLFGGYGGCTSNGRDSGGTIWGTVRSANNPDRGVSNTLISLDNENIFAVTTGTGYFSIMGVPIGTYDVKITKFGQEIFNGSAVVDRGLMSIPTGDAETRFSDFSYMVEFPASGPGDKPLAGTLLDPDGKPVAGAEVDVIYKELGYFFVTDTDTAGSFYFENLHESPDLLLIDAVGFRPAMFIPEAIETFMEAGSDGALVNLIPLEKDDPTSDQTPGAIKGTVRDKSENLVAGIKIALVPYNADIKPIDSIARIQTTGDGGTFDFANIDPGEYIIWAGGPNHFPVEKRITLPSAGTITLDLVLDEATNRETHPIFRQFTGGGQ